MKKIHLTFIALLTFISAIAQTTIYTNNMDYVIGDVKQAFIQNKITTEAQADYLLIGFKNLGVNGIRIPIFAEGHTPNKTMFDYFYNKAVAAGYPIFANPAQHSGGQRVACGILDIADICTVKDDDSKTNALIDRIIQFSYEYKCAWINPFNEDGAPGGAWSASQISTIYSSLNGNLNGAELVGSCAWGIPASINVMKQTTIADNITVATTHNLGFNHESWKEFIDLAKLKNLPIWDSEVTHNDKNKTGSRLETAIASNVDGLVMYDIWRTINQSNGSINGGGRNQMALYLKNMPTLTGSYQVDSGEILEGTSVITSAGSNVKLAPLPADGVWSWTGPNNFKANTREIDLTNITDLNAGDYVASYISPQGDVNHIVITIGLDCNNGANITPYYRINDVSWLVNSSITLNEGDKLQIGPQPTSGNWTWTGPNNFVSNSREITFGDITEDNSGEYTATFLNGTSQCGMSVTFHVTVESVNVPFPDPNARYYIDTPGFNVRLGANGEDAFTTSTSTTGSQVEWTIKESTSEGYYYINCIGSVANPRIRTQRTTVPQMTGSGSTGGQTKWLLTPSTNSTFYLDTALDNTSYPRLQIDNNKQPAMTVNYITNESVKFTFTDIRKGFVGDESDNILSIDKNLLSRLELLFPSYLNSSKDVLKPYNAINQIKKYQIEVYNIRGQKIFSSGSIEKGWLPNKNSRGIFVYVVKYYNLENQSIIKRGKVLVQ
ncbi:immunoglobulin domain-containing protein [Polaribacter sp. Asnod6-C07]|uniref:immunoglobulin domain-containing protein n=1 Tax=Polaribacter sp. Asnod6-C07 TaxID=3160582 RepID=UPI003868FF87